MPASEAKDWKEAFEVLLRKEIGQTDTTIYDGGPAWAVPLVLIPVDALHEGQKYNAERGKKYRARLKQLTAEDISLWRDKVDRFGGTELDAAVNIILLDVTSKKSCSSGTDSRPISRPAGRIASSHQPPANAADPLDRLGSAWRLHRVDRAAKESGLPVPFSCFSPTTPADVTSAGWFVRVKQRQRGPPCCLAWRVDDGGSGSLPRLRREAARRCARRVVPGLPAAGRPGRRCSGGGGPGLARRARDDCGGGVVVGGDIRAGRAGEAGRNPCGHPAGALARH